MKLSIWQQFSSNHSAAFSIVAQFETHEKAVQIADEITMMLLETYSMLDPDDENSRHGYDAPAQLQQWVEFDTVVGVTWMLNEQHVRRALQVFGNTIFVSDSPGYSNFDTSDIFFEKMLELGGGKVIAAKEASAEYVYMTIRARAKDEATAQQIIDTLEKQKRPIGKTRYMPDGIPAIEGADTISRDGSTVTFEDIYFSPFHFNTFSPWYRYLKNNDFTDVTLELTAYEGKDEVLRSVTLPFDQIKREVQTPYWAIADHPNMNKQKYPQVALATFKTEADAQAAANTIREILHRVRDWSDENAAESKAVWDVFWERLSPPEQEVQQKYNIEWTRSIVEWVHTLVRIRPVEDIIAILGNRLLLANDCNTWVGITPFHLILPQLAAVEVAIPANDMYRELACDIIVTAQSEILIRHIQSLIENLEKQDIPPWLFFFGGKKVENLEQWQEAVRQLTKNTQTLREVYEYLSGYWHERERFVMRAKNWTE